MLRGHDRGPSRTRHMGLHAPVAHGGIRTQAPQEMLIQVRRAGVAALVYTNMLVKRRGPVPRTIRRWRAGPGTVVLLGLAELAVWVRPAMISQTAGLAVDRRATVCPLVMVMILSDPCCSRQKQPAQNKQMGS